MVSSITNKIKRYKKGEGEALNEILTQMRPLVIKYAKLTFPLEYEDAKQEYYLTIIQSIIKMTSYETDAQCLKYIEVSVVNRYSAICQKYYSSPLFSTYDKEIPSFDSPMNAVIIKNDVKKYLAGMNNRSHKRTQIFNNYLEGLSDIQIADKMGISRQYVHRVISEIKRELSFFLDYE